MSSRVADHRQILGIVWVIYALFHVVGAGVLFVLANTFLPRLIQHMVPRPDMPPGFLGFFTPLMSFVGIVGLGKGLLALAAGIGLLQKQHWARLIALVSGFIALLEIPFGLALGIYAIWVLMAANGEEE